METEPPTHDLRGPEPDVPAPPCRSAASPCSGSGGLGWYIYENKNQIEIPNVFAGLLTVILIGLAVENLIFRWVENRTVRRWGMQT
jgi:ABC-type nitrate/sulfonate/bicarbonate transport system permease component